MPEVRGGRCVYARARLRGSSSAAVVCAKQRSNRVDDQHRELVCKHLDEQPKYEAAKIFVVVERAPIFFFES